MARRLRQQAEPGVTPSMLSALSTIERRGRSARGAVAGPPSRSPRLRTYPLYFSGQLVSMTGPWRQWVAQGWLVLRLTGSGFAVGAVTALQFLPMLLGGAYGGVIADRVDKRRLLVATQSTAGTLALVLGVLVVTGAVRLWMVFALALTLGIVNAIDNPTRQSF